METLVNVSSDIYLVGVCILYLGNVSKTKSSAVGWMAGLALDFVANGRRSTIACECTRTMAELRQEGDYRAIGWPASFEAWQRAGLS